MVLITRTHSDSSLWRYRSYRIGPYPCPTARAHVQVSAEWFCAGHCAAVSLDQYHCDVTYWL